MNNIGKTGLRIFRSLPGYLIAIAAVALATWLKYLAQPKIIPADVPILYILAIVPTAIFFGLGPSLTVCVLSFLAYDYYFLPPTHQINFNVDQTPIMLIFLVVGGLFSYLASNLRRQNHVAIKEIAARKQSEAELMKYRDHLEELVQQRTSELERANLQLKEEIIEHKKDEEALRQSEERWSTTLASIGDGVIATDVSGKVTFMNTIALDLTGWKMVEADQKPISEIFNIVSETTRQKLENPVDKVLQLGTICSLANHTILIRKDGTEISIDDSGAPIKNAEGVVIGVVLVFRNITERRKAEILVRQIEERNRLLADILEHASQAFGIGLPDGSLGIVNKAFCDLTGYTAGELKTKDWAKVLTPPDYLPMEIEKLTELEKTGQAVRYQKEYIRKDKSRVPIELLVHLVRNLEGQAEYYYSFLTDITERKKAEYENKKLMEAEKKHSEELQLVTENLMTTNKALLQAMAQAERNSAEIEAIIQAMPDAVYFGNENGITRCNARALEMLGASSLGDLQARIGELGAKFRVRYQKDRNSPLVEPENLPFTRGLKGEVAMLDTWATQGSTGKDVYIRGNAAPVIVNGKVIGAVAVNIDITESKQVEEKVNQLNRELRAINECDQVIVHANDELNLLFDICNVLCTTGGYQMAWISSVEHDAAKSIRPLAWCGDEGYIAKAKITWADSERGQGPAGLAVRTGRTHFFQDFAKDPAAAPWRETALSLGYLSSIAVPLVDGDGNVFALFSLYSAEVNHFNPTEVRLLEELGADISFGIVALREMVKRRQAEDELKQRTIELEASNHELEAFSYSVSHDLRAPLRSITGFSNVLLEDYNDELDKEGKSYLKKISDAGELMGQLMDDLLKLSRVTRSDLSRERVDLSDMARKIVNALRKDEPKRKVKVTIASDMIADGDKNLLNLALQNLLGNAWKYSSKTSEPRIEMGIIERNGKMAYFVRDNGVGFDMAYANKLFQPFQRLHKASEFAGTGIGLATVQRIIRRQGGEVWAEGKVGEGATFYFTLN